MWIFLLLRLMAEANDRVPPGAEELKLYRSRAELPAAWLKSVPEAFDFGAELIATRAQPSQPAWLSGVERVEPHRGDLYVWLPPEPPPARRECPPCRGIHTIDLDQFRREPEALPRGPLLLRVPKTASRVFLVHDLSERRALEPLECPPCKAP